MAIYDLIADKLFLKLQKEDKVADLSSQFNHIVSDAEKVEFAAKVWHDSKIDVDVPLRVPKDADKSKEYRMEGNKYFSLKNRNYVRALELYNQSICFAESNSEDLGIGYANRSAIYFEWKKYDLCLENINLAKDNQYPARLMDKLNKRETECTKAIEKDEKDDEEGDDGEEDILLAPKLSYPPHSKVPFIANCLEMRQSEEFGRYIVTNTDLPVGKVIAIEDGFCSLILPCVRYQRCANCLNECDYSLIPCTGCTSTMFCSEECRDEAYTNFHHIECPIIDFMFELLNIIQLSSVRVSISALTSFPSVDQLQRFVDDPETEQITAFSLDYCTNMPKSELYKPIHTLETNQSNYIHFFSISKCSSANQSFFRSQTNEQPPICFNEPSLLLSYIELLYSTHRWRMFWKPKPIKNF